MHLTIGAGQIGQAIASQLLAEGEDVTVLRRRNIRVPGTTTVVGDAHDPDSVRRAIEGCHVIHHAMHASAYRADVWRRELPGAERTVMDAAAAAGATVVFPESVYAFGVQAEDLAEGAAPAPIAPLGEVRAELLAARAAHPAATVSVVAADLVGTTVSPQGSIPTLTVLSPVLAGRRPMILADPEAPHAITDLADLAAAMIHVGRHRARFAGRTVHAPTAPPRSLRDLAEAAAERASRPLRTPLSMPRPLLTAAGALHPMARSLAQLSYLWYRPHRLRPGTLAEELPAPAWETVLDRAIEGVRREKHS